jgi:hypothetical protein
MLKANRDCRALGAREQMRGRADVTRGTDGGLRLAHNFLEPARKPRVILKFLNIVGLDAFGSRTAPLSIGCRIDP